MTLALVKNDLDHHVERNFQSYAGKQDASREIAFVIFSMQSRFMQHRQSLKQLYNRFDPQLLPEKINHEFSVSNHSGLRQLDDVLTSYLVLLEESHRTLLGPERRKNVETVLNLFNRKIFAKTTALQGKFAQISHRLNSEAVVGSQYLQEKCSELDSLVSEFLWWRQQSWLRGATKVKENQEIEDYGHLIEPLVRWEESSGAVYLNSYRSTVFTDVHHISNEQQYLHNVLQEYLGDVPASSKTMTLRIQQSLPRQLLRELDLLKGNLDGYNKLKTFARQACQSLPRELELIPRKSRQRDYFQELAGKYRPLSELFPSCSENLLYYQQDSAKYRQVSEQLHQLLQEKEMDLNKQLAQEKAEKEKIIDREHPLVIRPAQFDISHYVEKYHPQNQLLAQLQTLVGKNIMWEDKLDQFQVLLRQQPQFYSQADYAYLQDLEFALRTSLQEGVLGYLSQGNAAFKNKVLVVIGQLTEYAHNYRLNT